MVARHVVPGNAHTRSVPEGRYDTRSPQQTNIGRSLTRMTRESDADHPYPYRDGLHNVAFPGISCLATVIESLRDDVRLPFDFGRFAISAWLIFCHLSFVICHSPGLVSRYPMFYG